jgi:hypothetical protein
MPHRLPGSSPTPGPRLSPVAPGGSGRRSRIPAPVASAPGRVPQRHRSLAYLRVRSTSRSAQRVECVDVRNNLRRPAPETAVLATKSTNCTGPRMLSSVTELRRFLVARRRDTDIERSSCQAAGKGSRGSPSIRSAIWLRMISEVPPAIVRQRLKRKRSTTAASSPEAASSPLSRMPSSAVR